VVKEMEEIQKDRERKPPPIFAEVEEC